MLLSAIRGLIQSSINLVLFEGTMIRFFVHQNEILIAVCGWNCEPMLRSGVVIWLRKRSRDTVRLR